MDSKKVFFVVLVVIAVLYFTSLGTGVFVNKRDNDGQPQNLSDIADQGFDTLGSLLSAFAPALDLSELTCNDQPVKQSFSLQVKGHVAEHCEISIPKDIDEDYRKATLNIKSVGEPKRFYVRAKFDKNRFKSKDRKKNCYLDSEKLPDGLRLEVRYVPANGSSDDMWECWLAEEIGKPLAITALQDGGKLHLTLRCADCRQKPGCKNACNENKTHRVRLQME